MKIVLLFCPSLKGHRLEYLHHLYTRASLNKGVEYIVVAPLSTRDLLQSLSWEKCDNIKVFLRDGIDSTSSNIIVDSLKKCRNLGRIVNVYNPDEVFVFDLIEYVLFLPLFVSSRIKVSGIIYRIFLYEWEVESLMKKLQDVFKYYLFSRFNVFHKVFILNDKESACALNKKFHSDKFHFLPDPIAVIDKVQDVDIRRKYNIDNDKTIYLHPGGMMAYKGTVEILRALLLLKKETCEKICVIFAGRVTPEIQSQFNELYKLASNRVQLVNESGFIPFDYLGSLFQASDWILIPYKTKAQSSGILGHAAFFKKPVITVQGGLIGNLTTQNNLGVTIMSCTPQNVADVIENTPNWRYTYSDYVSSHSIDAFTNIILNRNV